MARQLAGRFTCACSLITTTRTAELQGARLWPAAQALSTCGAGELQIPSTGSGESGSANPAAPSVKLQTFHGNHSPTRARPVTHLPRFFNHLQPLPPAPGPHPRRPRPSSCRRSTVITPQHAPDRSHICPDFSITCSPSPARHPVRLTNLNSERHTDRRVASSPRVAPSPPRNIDAFCRCGRAQPAPARPVTHLLNIPRAPFAPIFQSPAAPPPPRGTLFQTAAVLT